MSISIPKKRENYTILLTAALVISSFGTFVGFLHEEIMKRICEGEKKNHVCASGDFTDMFYITKRINELVRRKCINE